MSVIPNGIAERYSLNPISLPELKFQNGKNMTVLKKKIQIAFVLEKLFFRKAYMQNQIVHPQDKRQTAVISKVPKESCLVIDLFVNSSDGIATDDLNLGNWNARSAVAKINDMLSGMMSIFFLLIFWKVINATRINEYARVTLCERQLRKKNMTDGMIFFLAKNAVKKRKNTIPV